MIFGACATSEELTQAPNQKHHSETLVRMGSEVAFPNGSRSALNISHCVWFGGINQRPTCFTCSHLHAKHMWPHAACLFKSRFALGQIQRQLPEFWNSDTCSHKQKFLILICEQLSLSGAFTIALRQLPLLHAKCLLKKSNVLCHDHNCLRQTMLCLRMHLNDMCMTDSTAFPAIARCTMPAPGSHCVVSVFASFSMLLCK